MLTWQQGPTSANHTTDANRPPADLQPSLQLGDFGLATYREAEGDMPEDTNLVVRWGCDVWLPGLLMGSSGFNRVARCSCGVGSV